MFLSSRQIIIKKDKTFRTVENLRGRGLKPKVRLVLARRIVGQKKNKDHHQGHPDKSGLCWWQYLKADSSHTFGFNGHRPRRTPLL